MDGEEKVEEKIEDKSEEVDFKAKAEALEVELTTAKEALQKLSDKEMNFGKLKGQTEDEKKKHNEEKLTLQEQVTALKDQITKSESQKVEELRDTTIQAIVGGDEEKAKAIKAEYELLNMPATNRDEIIARTKKAVRLAGYELEGDTSFAPTGSGREPQRTEKKFTDTDKGKATYGLLFPDLAPKK
jgi:hypothetical protein